jgi:hypothetical protein
MKLSKLELISRYLMYIENRIVLIEELLPDKDNQTTKLFFEFLQAWGRFMLHIDKKKMAKERMYTNREIRLFTYARKG